MIPALWSKLNNLSSKIRHLIPSPILVGLVLFFFSFVATIWLWVNRISYNHPGPAFVVFGLGIIALVIGWTLNGLWRYHSLQPVQGLELLCKRFERFNPKPGERNILTEQILILLSVAQFKKREIHVIAEFPGTKIEKGTFLIKYEGIEQPLVLKIDRMPNITIELERYKNYIEQRLGETPGSPLIPEQRYRSPKGEKWGATTYTFLGNIERERLQSFGEYYKSKQKSDTNDALERIIKTLRPLWDYKPIADEASSAETFLHNEYCRLQKRRSDIETGAREVGTKLEISPLQTISKDDPTSLVLPDDVRILNPIKWIADNFERSNWEHLQSKHSIVHGDFHAGNILIDDLTKPISVRLIDFPKTHIGPTVQDIARLEADIKCGLLSNNCLQSLGPNLIYAFESELLPKSKENQPLAHELQLDPEGYQQLDEELKNSELEKTWDAVRLLRRKAMEYLTADDARPYYLALLHGTLPMVAYRDRTPWQKLYAFISAALLCEHLE